MLIRFFRYNYQVELFTIIIVGGLFWFWGFNSEAPPLPALEAAPLSTLLLDLPRNWITSALALVLLLIEGYLISTITGRFKILRLTNLLPSLIYVLLMSFNQNLLTLTPSLVCNFFVIILFYYLFELYSAENTFFFTFNTSLAIGITMLLIPENAILLLLVWVTFVIYRSYGLREWIISLLGILVTGIFTISIFYLNNNLQELFNSYTIYFSNLEPGYPKISTEYLPFIIVIAFLTLITVPRMAFKLDENIIPSRKRLNIVIFAIIIFLGILFINPSYWEYTISALFIPLSITISRLIISIKKERNKDWVLLLIIIAITLERIL